MSGEQRITSSMAVCFSGLKNISGGKRPEKGLPRSVCNFITPRRRRQRSSRAVHALKDNALPVAAYHILPLPAICQAPVLTIEVFGQLSSMITTLGHGWP